MGVAGWFWRLFAFLCGTCLGRSLAKSKPHGVSAIMEVGWCFNVPRPCILEFVGLWVAGRRAGMRLWSLEVEM